MKRITIWIALTGLTFSLMSCGLPGAAVRTVSSAVKSVGGMANGLAGSAAAASLL